MKVVANDLVAKNIANTTNNKYESGLYLFRRGFMASPFLSYPSVFTINVYVKKMRNSFICLTVLSRYHFPDVMNVLPASLSTRPRKYVYLFGGCVGWRVGNGVGMNLPYYHACLFNVAGLLRLFVQLPKVDD